MTDAPSRCLGIDLGDVRIGLALSDPSGVVAQPFAVLECAGPRRAVEAVARAIAAENVATVIVGFPLLLSGAEGQRARAARSFVGRLARRVPTIHIELWDERFTTAQADRTMVDGGVRRLARRKSIDAMAAALILQSWLDARAERR